MKKLNQNNTIATTAMLTKTNTMKNKMNFFARVFVLVVIIMLLIPQGIWGQKWTQNGSTWYILQQTIGNSKDKKKSESWSIYAPINTSGTINYTSDKSCVTIPFVGEVCGTIRFYVENTGVADVYSGNYEESPNGSKPFNVSQGTRNVTYGWESDIAHTLGNKSITISIPLPKHTDINTSGTTTSYTFDDAAINGTTTKNIDFAQFFKSFYTNNAITATIIGANAQYFHLPNNAQSITIANASSVYASASCFTEGSSVGSLNTANATVSFTPTAAGDFTATLRITYDGGTKDIELKGKGTAKNATFNWKIDDLAVGEEKEFSEVVGINEQDVNQTGLTIEETNSDGTTPLTESAKLNISGTTITGLAEGTTYIKATFTFGNTNYKSPASDVHELTVSLNELAEREIVWNADFTSLRDNSPAIDLSSDGWKATWQATTPAASGDVVNYVIADPSIASISGNILTILKEGVTSITATVDADATYKKATMTKPLVVSSSSGCNTYLVNQTLNNTSDYTSPEFNGRPKKVIWTVVSNNFGSAEGKVYLRTMGGVEIASIDVKKDKSYSTPTDLPSQFWNERQFKVTGLREASSIIYPGTRTLTSFQVIMASYLEPIANNSISFGEHDNFSESTLIPNIANYANLPGNINVEIVDVETGGNNTWDCFKFSNNTYASSVTTGGCGVNNQGTASITIKFVPKQMGEHKARLKVSAYDGNSENPVTFYIPITGSGKKVTQNLTWDNEHNIFTGTYNALSGNVALTGAASTDGIDVGGELTIIYSSSNTTVADVVTNGGIQYIDFKTEGTFRLRANCAGNNVYSDAAQIESGDITVSLATPTLTFNAFPASIPVFSTTTLTASTYTGANIDMTVISKKDGTNPNATLSKSTNIASGEDVTLTANTRVSDAGEGNIKVVASIAATNIYEAKTETLTVNATKATPIINWPESSTELSGTRKVGDEVQLNAIIQQNSSYKVTYESSNTTLATVDNNTGKMTCVAPGIVKITAKFTENVDLIASTADEEISYLFLISPADFGEVKILSNETTPFLISTGESGTFDISSTDMAGFFVSNDNTTGWSNSGLTGITDGSTIYFKFQPNAATEFSKSFTVTHNSKTYSGSLTGTGDAQLADFGNVNIGQASNEIPFSLQTLSSQGATSFTITPSDPYIFRVFTDNESASSSATAQGAITLTEGNSFNVKFYPETAGETNGTITVTTDNNLTIDITIKGTGVRQSLNFGEVTLGNTSATSMQIDLTNMVSANDYTVTSNKPALFRINEQTDAVTLSGNASFNIRFYPQSAATYNDNNIYYVTIHDNSTNKEYKIYCSGIGTGRQQIDFGSVAFSEGSSSVSISVSGYPATGFKLKVDNYQSFWINGQLMQNGADITSSDENTFSISFHPQTTGNVNDKVYITDGTNNYDVVNVKGNGTPKELTLNWVDNDKLNVGDVESHLATTGVGTDDYITVTYSSSDNSILYVDNDNPSQVIAVGTGTATLTATIDPTKGQNGNFTFTNSSEFPISKEFTVTEDRILVIVPGTNIKRLGNLKTNTSTVTLDATVQFKDGTSYTAHPTPDYSLTNNDGCVTLNGCTLTVNQAGQATLQMSVDGDPANQIIGDTLTYNIVVTDIGDCSHTELDINGFSFTSQSIKGLVRTLTVQKKNGELPPMRKLAFHWVVEGYAPQYTFDVKENDVNGNTLMPQKTGYYASGNRKDMGDVEIDLTNNQLENICFEFHSTFIGEWSVSTASITDVHVYQQSYFRKAANEPSSLTFDSTEYGKSMQLPLNFDYSAISSLTFEIVSGDNCFSRSDSDLDIADCSDFGQKTVNVVFTPNKVGQCQATIRIKAHTIDGDVWFDYTVNGTGTQRNQIINNWSEDETLSIIARYENISIGNDQGDRYRPAEPQYNVDGESIEYSSDNEAVITVDQNSEGKWLIHVISQGEANITAHIDGDVNTTEGNASRKFTVQKGDQNIVWDSWDATNGKTIKTNCDATSMDVLLDAKTQDVADHDIPTDEVTFTYEIVPTDPCDNTHTTLAEIATGSDGKKYLRYNGNGAGDVVVSVSVDACNNYYAAKNNGLIRTLHIVRTPSNEYTITGITRDPNDLKYGDLVTLSSGVTFDGNPYYDLTNKVDGEYSSSNQLVAETSGSNQLKVKSVSSFDLTYTVKQNCYMESRNYNINISTYKTDQAIAYVQIPDQSTFNQGQPTSIDLNEYFYSVDKRHSVGNGYDGIATYLPKNDNNEVLTELPLGYSVSFTPDSSQCGGTVSLNSDNHTITISGSGAGVVTIEASQSGNTNYNSAPNMTKTFRVNRITPTVTVVEPESPVAYSTTPYTLSASSTGTNYSSTSDASAAYTFTVADDGGTGASISGDQLTVQNVGTVKIKATQKANCIVNSATSDEYELVIGKATPSLTASPNPVSLTYPQDLENGSVITLTSGNTDGDVTFSCSVGDDDLVDVTQNGNQFTIKPKAKTGSATLTFTSSETSNYYSATTTVDVSVSWGELELIADESKLLLHTAMNGFPLDNLTDLVSSNYLDGNVNYTYAITAWTGASGDAAIDDTQELITIKSLGNITIEITGTHPGGATETVQVGPVAVAVGTLEFRHTTDNRWDTEENWYPHCDRVPDATNFDVLIADSCFIGKVEAEVADEETFLSHTVNAACNNLTIDGTDAKLVIGEASTLNVVGNLTNNDSSKLVLTANMWGQASVVFGNDGSTEHPNPKATVEMYIPEGNGNHIDPKWQYRGICVSDFSPITVVPVVDEEGNLTEEMANPWDNVHVFEWDESQNADLTDGCWKNGRSGSDITNGSLQPWKGYCFANMMPTPSSELWLTYTGTLINSSKGITLSYNNYTYTDENNQQVPFANVGINLITNSYAAPLLISQLDYTNVNCEKGVVLYNAGSHKQWEQGGNAGNLRGQEGQFSTVPQSTGEDATDIITIPAGQSFFVQATGTGATLTLPYSTAISISPSTRMYLPRKEIEPEYNILKIRVTAKSDSAQDYVALLECETCTRQYDNGYDGRKKFGDSGLPQIYAYNKFGNTAVNADSTLNKQYVGFMAGSDDETYTISFETDKLFGYHSLYLTDRKLNETVDILAGETYQFKGYTVGENMRFQINGITEQEWEENKDDNDDDDDDDSSVCDLRVVGNTLYVQGFTIEHYPAARIEFFDMTGNLVWSTPLTSERLYDLPQLPQGIYTIRLGDCHVKYSSMK